MIQKSSGNYHQSCQGIADACEILETPVVSGNVSLYNENNGKAIYPSPMIGMVGLIKNYDHVIPMHMQTAGRQDLSRW